MLNGSHIFVSFTRILLLFGTVFQYLRKRRQDEEGRQSDKARIRDFVHTFCPSMHSVQLPKETETLDACIGVKPMVMSTQHFPYMYNERKKEFSKI